MNTERKALCWLFVIIAIVVLALLLYSGGDAQSINQPEWVKDTCWIENYLDIDFTVCEVPGGIYILTPTPTPTDRPKVKHGRPDKFTSTSVPIPTYEESTPAPTMDPWATEPGYPAPSVEPTATLTRTLSPTATSGPGYPAPSVEPIATLTRTPNPTATLTRTLSPTATLTRTLSPTATSGPGYPAP